MRPEIYCHCCGKLVATRLGHRRICRDCITAGYYQAAYKARMIAYRATVSGLIPRAKTQTCVDCGKPACDNDHRDYDEPLKVEPVCRSCNLLRGPGKWARPDIFKQAA